jgi:hypothetical protein
MDHDALDSFANLLRSPIVIVVLLYTQFGSAALMNKSCLGDQRQLNKTYTCAQNFIIDPSKVAFSYLSNYVRTKTRSQNRLGITDIFCSFHLLYRGCRHSNIIYQTAQPNIIKLSSVTISRPLKYRRSQRH